MTYPGGKGGAGVAHAIIGQMPPHRAYVELFAGSAAVFFAKRPAEQSVLVEKCWDVCKKLRSRIAESGEGGRAKVVKTDVLKMLGVSHPILREPDTLVYADPPYLRETRSRLFYKHEFASPEQHAWLLEGLRRLKCLVMVSGYYSPLYEELLGDWRLVAFQAMTRGGVRTECLWCNFPAPQALHDPALRRRQLPRAGANQAKEKALGRAPGRDAGPGAAGGRRGAG